LNTPASEGNVVALNPAIWSEVNVNDCALLKDAKSEAVKALISLLVKTLISVVPVNLVVVAIFASPDEVKKN
jgi:hypothetical protein